MISTIIVFAIAAVILKYIYDYFVKANEGLPPGPRPWPIVGSLLSIDQNRAHESLHEMSKEYGPIFSVYFGPKLAIILNNIDAVKESFLKQADTFAGRPDLYVNDEVFSGGKRGIIGTDGEPNKELRRFSLSVLRDFGLGKGRATQLVNMELENLLRQIGGMQSKEGKVDPALSIKVSVVNVIMRLLFDKTQEFDDPEFAGYQQRASELLKQTPVTFLYNSWPWLRFILPPQLTGLQKLISLVDLNLDYINKQIMAHKRVKAESVSEANDYTARFLLKIHQDELAGHSGPPFDEKNLKIALNEMYFAGFETTVSTLMWGLLFLAKYPDIQTRMAAEISLHMGQAGVVPEWEDRNSLPFSVAVITEVQRLGSVVPLGVFHRPMVNTKVMGYNTPADCMIISNIYAIGRDERIFPDPERFDPSRYLEESGASEEQIRTRREAVIPFSVGKRSCLGEALARMELFIFLTGIVATYRFHFPKDEPEPPLKGQSGFTCAPYPFSLVFVKRS